MKRNNSLRLILVLLGMAGLLFVSCHRNDPNLPPSITIHQPYENQLFTIGDTILVTATIKDESRIEKVIVQLVDDDYVPRGPAIELTVGLEKYELSQYYIIPKNLDFTSSYMILVRAYDETDFKNKYQPILIHFPAQVRRGLLVVTQKTPNLKSIYHLDTLNQIHWIMDIAGDSGSSAYWSQAGLLAIAGTVNGDLSVLRTADTTIAWTINCIPDPPHPFFLNTFAGDDAFYVCFEEGFVGAYNMNGIKSLQTPASDLMTPSTLVLTNEYISVFWKDRANVGGRIIRHYRSSGQDHDYIPVSIDLECLVAKEDGVIFAFGNDNGQAQVWKVESGGLQTTFALPFGKFLDAQYIGSGYFAVSQSSGTYIYNEFGLQFSVFTQDYSGMLSFDEEEDILYSSKGNTLSTKVLGSSIGAVHKTFPYPIIGVHPWYEH